ncbi:MAG: hydrogenase 3 maturation endopeptidase HyCI [Terriglobales bacterium]
MAGESKTNLREQLECTLRGRVCLMGVGNADYGDDALGVYLAEALVEAGVPDVIVAGNSPERYLGRVADMRPEHVLFLDAVEFGAAPGAVVFLNSQQLTARYPQISTHKISLSTLATFVEANGVTRAWLLGVQPESLKEGQSLTSPVRKTLDALLRLLLRAKRQEMSLC